MAKTKWETLPAGPKRKVRVSQDFIRYGEGGPWIVGDNKTGKEIVCQKVRLTSAPVLTAETVDADGFGCGPAEAERRSAFLETREEIQIVRA